MHLVIVLECEVEDETEAQNKTKAVHDVIKVYPFVRISASINGKVDIPEEPEV